MTIASATLIALLHGLLVLSVTAGALCSLAGKLHPFRRLEHLFLGLVACVIVSQLLYGECVLTRWEKSLRDADSPGTAYRESFLAHYLPGLPHGFYVWSGPAVVLCGLLSVVIRRLTVNRIRDAGGSKEPQS